MMVEEFILSHFRFTHEKLESTVHCKLCHWAYTASKTDKGAAQAALAAAAHMVEVHGYTFKK